MSYTPQTWANGDIITATKLNNIESGVQSVSNSYTPTTWVNGDIITAVKLNNIEQGIANAGGGSSDFSTAEVTLISDTMDGDGTEFPFAYVDRDISTINYGALAEYNNSITYEAILFGGAIGVVSPVSNISVSGSATVNSGPGGRTLILITGDCTITIS